MALTRPRPDYGNGRLCPDNPEHGHLYALTRGEWCPVTASYPHPDAFRSGLVEVPQTPPGSEPSPEPNASTAGDLPASRA